MAHYNTIMTSKNALEVLLPLRHLLRVLTSPYKTTVLAQRTHCHCGLKALNRIVQHRVIAHDLQNHQGMMLFILSECQQKHSTKLSSQVFSVSHYCLGKVCVNLCSEIQAGKFPACSGQQQDKSHTPSAAARAGPSS